MKSRRPRFICIDDDVPERTITLLSEACDARGVAFEYVVSPSFDFAPRRRARPGDLMYRPAISLHAMRVEQFLYAEGVATFHARPGGVYFECTTSPLLFERAGLPIPRTVYGLVAHDRDLLLRHVARLGGFPVIVKLLGWSGGVGTIRVDSAPALYSTLDLIAVQNLTPFLCQYVPDATHWRVIVVGDRAVAGYRNVTQANDFRTAASDDPSDYARPVERRLARIATGAVRALQLEFGGIDLLVDARGRPYLLEANFPCYFGHAQDDGGVDVAGAMIDHLLAKARRVARPGPATGCRDEAATK
jgi:hypothetical protein